MASPQSPRRTREKALKDESARVRKKRESKNLERPMADDSYVLEQDAHMNQRQTHAKQALHESLPVVYHNHYSQPQDDKNVHHDPSSPSSMRRRQLRRQTEPAVNVRRTTSPDAVGIHHRRKPSLSHHRHHTQKEDNKQHDGHRMRAREKEHSEPETTTSLRESSKRKPSRSKREKETGEIPSSVRDLHHVQKEKEDKLLKKSLTARHKSKSAGEASHNTSSTVSTSSLSTPASKLKRSSAKSSVKSSGSRKSTSKKSLRSRSVDSHDKHTHQHSQNYLTIPSKANNSQSMSEKKADLNDTDNGFGFVITSPQRGELSKSRPPGNHRRHNHQNLKNLSNGSSHGSSKRRIVRHAEPSQRISQSEPFVPIDDMFGDFCDNLSPSLRAKPIISAAVGNHLMTDQEDDAMQVFLPAAPRLWKSMSNVSSDGIDADLGYNDDVVTETEKVTAQAVDTEAEKSKFFKTKNSSRRPKSMSMSHVSRNNNHHHSESRVHHSHAQHASATKHRAKTSSKASSLESNNSDKESSKQKSDKSKKKPSSSRRRPKSMSMSHVSSNTYTYEVRQPVSTSKSARREAPTGSNNDFLQQVEDLNSKRVLNLVVKKNNESKKRTPISQEKRCHASESAMVNPESWRLGDLSETHNFDGEESLNLFSALNPSGSTAEIDWRPTPTEAASASASALVTKSGRMTRRGSVPSSNDSDFVDEHDGPPICSPDFSHAGNGSKEHLSTSVPVLGYEHQRIEDIKNMSFAVDQILSREAATSGAKNKNSLSSKLSSKPLNYHGHASTDDLRSVRSSEFVEMLVESSWGDDPLAMKSSSKRPKGKSAQTNSRQRSRSPHRLKQKKSSTPNEDGQRRDVERPASSSSLPRNLSDPRLLVEKTEQMKDGSKARRRGSTSVLEMTSTSSQEKAVRSSSRGPSRRARSRGNRGRGNEAKKDRAGEDRFHSSDTSFLLTKSPSGEISKTPHSVKRRGSLPLASTSKSTGKEDTERQSRKNSSRLLSSSSKRHSSKRSMSPRSRDMSRSRQSMDNSSARVRSSKSSSKAKSATKSPGRRRRASMTGSSRHMDESGQSRDAGKTSRKTNRRHTASHSVTMLETSSKSHTGEVRSKKYHDGDKEKQRKVSSRRRASVVGGENSTQDPQPSQSNGIKRRSIKQRSSLLNQKSRRDSEESSGSGLATYMKSASPNKPAEATSFEESSWSALTLSTKDSARPTYSTKNKAQNLLTLPNASTLLDDDTLNGDVGW